MKTVVGLQVLTPKGRKRRIATASTKETEGRKESEEMYTISAQMGIKRFQCCIKDPDIYSFSKAKYIPP